MESEKAAAREIVADLLKNKIIRESSSPFASPIILVKKKDGSYRMCVDYLSRNPPKVRRVTSKSWLHVEQRSNEEVQNVLEQLREGSLDSNQYCEKDGLLYHRQTNTDGTVNLQWYVSRQSRLGLLRIFHDE